MSSVSALERGRALFAAASPPGVMFLVWNGGNRGDAELKYGLELLAIAVGSVAGKRVREIYRAASRCLARTSGTAMGIRRSGIENLSPFMIVRVSLLIKA